MLLSPVLPACAIYTALGLRIVHQQTISLEIQEKQTHFWADSLPAILAFHGVLNNGIARKPAIKHSNTVQSKSNTEKVEDLIDECALGLIVSKTASIRMSTISRTARSDSPIAHDHSAVLQCKLHSIVTMILLVMGAASEDGELFIKVSIDER